MNKSYGTYNNHNDFFCKDFKSGIREIEVLRSNYSGEIKRREAFEATCKSLKQENERLMKLYTESFNNLADQLERRNVCQNLNEELKRVKEENLIKENEHKKVLESLEQDYAAKVTNLEEKVRSLQLEKTTNEVTINHLHQDLAAHKSHIQALASKLDQIRYEEEANYCLEIQDLRDCLMVEQEEKNGIIKKLEDLQKELLISRGKLGEQQRDVASNRFELRKLNSTIKRSNSCSIKRVCIILLNGSPLF